MICEFLIHPNYDNYSLMRRYLLLLLLIPCFCFGQIEFQLLLDEYSVRFVVEDGLIN